MRLQPARFTGPAHTARTLALQVLLDCRNGDAFVQEVLDAHLGGTDIPVCPPLGQTGISAPPRLSPADRRLTTHLAYGVLRRRGSLDALLQPLINRDPHNVEPWLWDVLHLGAYQLAYLSHVPAHAALH
jgi:transcription termination factor NusB